VDILAKYYAVFFFSKTVCKIYFGDVSMTNCNFYMPVRMLSGKDCVTKNASELKKLGSRCLIITGHNSARKCGALDDCIDALTSCDIAYRIFDGIEQNPTLKSCAEAGAEARYFKADFIIGIGGGSPLDAAKAAAVLAVNDMDPFDLYKADWENPALPFVLVGTTAGTGSEITPFSVLTNEKTGRKKSFSHPGQTYAKIAFCDPKYTFSLPYDFTVSTALDALSHALEGYYGSRANDISDMFALLAVKEIFEALKQISSDCEITPSLREQLYYGSLHAGMTLNHCSTCFCHQFGYFLSEDHHIPHGFACATTLPEFTLRGKQFKPDKAATMETYLNCSIEELCHMIELWNTVQLPRLTEAEIDAIIPRYENAKHLRESPGGFTLEEARELFIKKFSR